MKKLTTYNQLLTIKFFPITLSVVGCLLFATTTYAATVTFAPAVINVVPRQLVNVNIVIDPQGTAYTAKIALSFPPNLLAVSSFSHASGWMPLSQPGYDSIDNSSGSLVKTAGAAGGFSSPRHFGTVTFVAQSAGTANIAVSGNTQILNANNQNTFSGGVEAVVNISPVQNTQPLPQVPASKPDASPSNSANPKRNLLKERETSISPAATNSGSTTEIYNSQSRDLAASAGVPDKALPWSFIIPLLTFFAGLLLGSRALHPEVKLSSNNPDH